MYYFASLSAPQAVAAIAEAAAVAAATADSPLKKNLKWKMQQGTGMPSLTLPTVTADDDVYLDPRLAMSPNLPGAAAGLMVQNLFHPAFGLAGCNPGAVLERFGPNILRSHVPTAHYKAIPHNDEIDLEAFRRKDPREWSMDDVIGWMISVAKRRGIPVEDMNMHRFATCTGPFLTLMSQQNFIERDPTYGSLLYLEFRKLMGDDGSSFLDDWIRMHKDEIDAGFSVGTSSAAATSALLSSLAAEAVASSSLLRMPTITSDQPCTSRQADGIAGRHASFGQRESVIKAAGSSTNIAGPSSFTPVVNHMGSLPDLCKLKTGLIKPEANDNHCDGPRFSLKFGDSVSRSVGAKGSNGAVVSSSTIPKFPDGKIKKKLNEGSCSLTISGKPRKRSQHTRGNKLWEFIRSALRDSRTCPSVVKWEDEREGVFRIVESEKLARLWGERKNNQKMTYEKLSRAMRTYYEKQILVPVPKTGLYPKKLVYKFGPNAKGWQQTQTGTTNLSTTAILKTPRSNNAEKTTNHPKAGTAPNVPFPLRPPGILSLSSGGCGGRMNGVSSTSLSNTDSAALVAAASGLMSLADVASRRLAATSRGESEEVIDVDGHSETGDCVSAIEATMVDEDEIIDDDEEDIEEDD